MNWTIISNIATIATLILFVIYFIGRIITIFMEKQLCYDEISFLSVDDTSEYDIIDELDMTSSDDYITVVILTSKYGIRNIKVFEIVFDENYKKIKNCSKEIGSVQFLNIGQSFAIKTQLPEIFPKYRLVYYTHDFKKVTFDISDNLKSGVASEMLRAKHTFRSVFYYLFR